MKLLIAQAYHLRFDPKLWEEMKPYPPLGSLLAAAVCRDAGCNVAFHDSMLSDGVPEFEARLAAEQPDVVLLYEDNFNYLTKMCLLNMREAARQMLQAARQAGALGLVCSSDASDHPELYFDMGADHVLLGEGEATLMDLLHALHAGSSTAGIKGLVSSNAGARTIATEGAATNRIARRPAGDARNNPEGRVSRTPVPKVPVSDNRRPVLTRLDELPFPAWDLVDLARYRDIWLQRHGYYSVNLATTRGCPYHCNWCAKPIWGQRYNARSPEHVADELALLGQYVELDHVWFADDIFGLKPRWTARFADCLEARNLAIRFKCLSRADLLLRPGEVDALARAGCETVWIGAESGSQKVLDAMEKGTTLEQIDSASRQLRQSGIRVGYFIQFGYPGEGWTEIGETLRLILTNLPDEMGISVSYPLPGTGFHEQVAAQLRDKRNWVDSNDLAMMYEGRFPTVFYRRLYAYAHQRLAYARLRAGDQRSAGVLARMCAYGLLAAVNGALLGLLQFAGRDTGVRIAPSLDRLQSSTPSVQPD